MRIPKLRRHSSGQGRVEHKGKTIYFGLYGTARCSQKYRRWVNKLTKENRERAKRAIGLDPEVGEVVEAYLRFAIAEYVDDDGTPTMEYGKLFYATMPVVELFGKLPAGEFTAKKLKAVRDEMIKRGWVRKHINAQVARVKRCFTWAVEEELIDPSIMLSLQAVKGLKKGKTTAPESKKVRPVPDPIVSATLPFLPPAVAAMVRIQRLTGMRSGELCQLRYADITKQDDVWIFTPASHKTEHLEKERVICLGPKAQFVLQHYPTTKPDEFIFSPRRTVREVNDIRRHLRKTKVQPSQQNRNKFAGLNLSEKYDAYSYRQSIDQGIERAIAAQAKLKAAGEELSVIVERWTPHQLRHRHATEVRKRYGIEAARVSEGHSSIDATELYAEADAAIARKVSLEIG